MKYFLAPVVAFICLSLPRYANAHFPWLVQTDEGRAALFFGETLADRTYHLPESLQNADVIVSAGQKASKLNLVEVSTDDFVGLVSKESLPVSALIRSKITYGVYHGNRLEYSASHFCGELPTTNKLKDHTGPEASILVAKNSGVEVQVSFGGKPLSDTEIHLYDADGVETMKKKTDASGKVAFAANQLNTGLNGLMFGHTDEDAKGEIRGEEYQSTMYYNTMTFVTKKAESDQSTAKQFADLPFELTSFGAARVGSTAYVYGGHIGEAHSYSTEEQSNKLMALNLSDPAESWNVVSTGTRLQGLAMVPHNSSVILIGGFTAKNAPGEDHDLHSQATVRAFNTATRSWEDLPSLPRGRSSHDAAIIGDTIYVVGGWQMEGDEETMWHSSALSMNLASPNPKWREIPDPPFKRRALATAAHQGKLYVVGGMDKDAGPTRAVSVFDPKTQGWSVGPDLLGEGRMAGFGAAAWSVDGKLIVSTYEGRILQLSEDGSKWNSLGKTKDSRFFHRLIPLDNNRLVAVGGANMESGKFLNLEVVTTSK